MSNPVQQFYGNRIRVRACGLLVRDETLLMVNHTGLYDHDFWAPPGGGVEPGESLTDALVREFKEETALQIKPGGFLFATEFIAPPLHAIEFFFEIISFDGTPKTGFDPETSQQLVSEVRFIPWDELQNWPRHTLHGIFQKVEKPWEILDLRGYFKL